MRYVRLKRDERKIKNDRAWVYNHASQLQHADPHLLRDEALKRAWAERKRRNGPSSIKAKPPTCLCCNNYVREDGFSKLCPSCQKKPPSQRKFKS